MKLEKYLKLDKYWYIILVPIICFCYFAALMFLISGIMNKDHDVLESIKLFTAGTVQTLFLYIPYKVNTPSPKKVAFAKSKYESAISGFNIPEEAKTIVISGSESLSLKEQCVIVWRGAQSLYILTAGEEPQQFSYPLIGLKTLLRCDNSYSKEEINEINEKWYSHNLYVRLEFDIFRKAIKKGKAITYKLGDIEMSPHSCYVLLGMLKADLANIDFGEGDRKEMLEQYYTDGAIPHYIYTREKTRIR